jgi:hypothetical protein
MSTALTAINVNVREPAEMVRNAAAQLVLACRVGHDVPDQVMALVDRLADALESDTTVLIARIQAVLEVFEGAREHGDTWLNPERSHALDELARAREALEARQ